jgi:aminoglycoside phosphotransferase (APT) family kinase protein
MVRMHEDEASIDAALAARLVAEQFPDWAGLPITPVDSYGTDNAIYRLGDELAVRLPRIHWAVAPVQREFAWLPRIARALPAEVPVPVALGAPGDDFGWPWTVCRWLAGEHPSATGGMHDELMLARDLAGFVQAMRALDPAGAPATAWPRPLHEEDEFVRVRSGRLGGGRLGGELGTGGPVGSGAAPDPLGARGHVDPPSHLDPPSPLDPPSHLDPPSPLDVGLDAVVRIWDAAMAAPRHQGARVWIHGDLTPSNLLLRDGRLTGVLDFGAMGLGDPASDLRVAWNLLSPEARSVFRAEVGADDATWARARGWALLQSLAQLSYFGDRNPPLTDSARRVISALVAERP